MADLSAMTVSEYDPLLADQTSLTDFFGEACFSSLTNTPTFQKLLANFQCDVKAPKEQCLSALVLLKAYFISDQAGQKDLEDMTPEELAANAARAFFDLDVIDQNSFKKNQKYLNALHKLYPNDADIIEAYVGYLMIGGKITGDSSVTDLIEPLLQNSEGLSFKLDRLKVFGNMVNESLDQAKDNLDRLGERYPQEPEVAYLYAAYYWKRGNRELANSYLDRAIGLGASCSFCMPGTYKETKRRLKTAKAGDRNLFSLSIGLNFENI